MVTGRTASSGVAMGSPAIADMRMTCAGSTAIKGFGNYSGFGGGNQNQPNGQN
jgi:hypothetical protein